MTRVFIRAYFLTLSIIPSFYETRLFIPMFVTTVGPYRVIFFHLLLSRRITLIISQLYTCAFLLAPSNYLLCPTPNRLRFMFPCTVCYYVRSPAYQLYCISSSQCDVTRSLSTCFDSPCGINGKWHGDFYATPEHGSKPALAGYHVTAAVLGQG